MSASKEQIEIDDVESSDRIDVEYRQDRHTNDRLTGVVESVKPADSTVRRVAYFDIETDVGDRYRVMFGGAVYDANGENLTDEGYAAKVYRKTILTDGGQEADVRKELDHTVYPKIGEALESADDPEVVLDWLRDITADLEDRRIAAEIRASQVDLISKILAHADDVEPPNQSRGALIRAIFGKIAREHDFDLAVYRDAEDLAYDLVDQDNQIVTDGGRFETVLFDEDEIDVEIITGDPGIRFGFGSESARKLANTIDAGLDAYMGGDFDDQDFVAKTEKLVEILRENDGGPEIRTDGGGSDAFEVEIDGKPWVVSSSQFEYDAVHAVAGAILAGADTIGVQRIDSATGEPPRSDDDSGSDQ